LFETVKVFGFSDQYVDVGQRFVLQVLLAEPCLTHEKVGTVVQLFAQSAESEDFGRAFRVVSFNQ
jgi:hypothetical protein